MISVTVKHGGTLHPISVEDGTTFGQLKQNRTLKAVLGCGDNNRALVDGVEMPDDARIGLGTLVTFETAVNQKGLLL